MSSGVRGQANLHDSIESNSSNSNKRKRVINQNPRNLYLSMHPPQADQVADDQLLQKQEEEAAALLNHMHLLHHGDHHHHLRAIHIDHDNRYAAGHNGMADHHQVMQRHAGRESSGSSDASAAYFSGDSDLTAEPIMGCTAADENGAKSSNSGGSTPLKLSQAARRTDQAQACAAGMCQEYCANLPMQNDKAHNDKEEASRTLTQKVAAPSTSTSSRNCNTFPDSEILSPLQMIQKHAAPKTMISCSHSPPECANSGRDSESWLELRLGYSADPQHGLAQNQEASRHELTKSREFSMNETELVPVTLQLLPEKPKNTTETCSVAAAAMRSSMLVQDPHTVTGSGLYGSLPIPLPNVHQPGATAFSHMRPKFDGFHHRIPGAAPLDNHQFMQSADPAASLDYPDHQQFLLHQSNDPPVALNESHWRPELTGYDTGRIVYDQMQAFADCNDQRRWVAADKSDMMMMAVSPMISAARPTEIHRPTGSLGWPPGAAIVSSGEARPWSASPYTSPMQLQRTVSWQGLVRSMATDPLLHALPELSMHSLDAGAETSGSRRCHMLPACARPPSSRATTPAPINHQRLRPTSSRRNTGVWFSLQEADHILNENREDHPEQLSNQSMQKVYLRIRDGKMQISVLKSYLIRKLGSVGEHQYTNTEEVEITCRGKVLSPTLTIQHVRDTIWLNKEFEHGEAIGFRYTNSYLDDSHNRVMDLCYQRHHTQTITLNLLKT